jgi:hypothetical protein
MPKANLFFTCVLIGALSTAGAALAADELGRVSAVAGEATAQQPGAEPRALACGDPVFAGDTLRTGSNSTVGVQLDDVATHLDANTQVVIGRTPESTPSARLLAGKVRMIDPRDAGAPPAQLAALDTDARVVSNDAEAYIFSEKVGPYAMMCEWDAPLPVNRGSESKTAKPGECVIAKPKEPLYTANAHDARIPALAQECAPGPELASLNDPRHHLSPADVAALGPMAAAFSPPQPAPDPAYVCDQAGICSPVIPIQVVEPAPDIEDPCGFGFCAPPAPPVKEGAPVTSTPPAPPVKDGPPISSAPPAPPIKDGPPISSAPPAPPIKDGPPPFSNTPPAPPVANAPPFSDVPPAPPVGDAPPFTNEFPGQANQTPPVTQPPVIEPPVTTAGFGPPPFSNIFPGQPSTPPAPFTDVPPAPPVADVPPFTNVFPAQGANAPFTTGFPAQAPNLNPGA